LPVDPAGLFGAQKSNHSANIARQAYAAQSGIPGNLSILDILIELEKPIGWRFFSLEIYLGKIFGRKIDLVAKNALKEQKSEEKAQMFIVSEVPLVWHAGGGDRVKLKRPTEKTAGNKGLPGCTGLSAAKCSITSAMLL